MGYDYESDIKCPYCDYVFHDSWEYNQENESEIYCEECGLEFTMNTHIEITYSSSRIDCEDLSPPREHDYKRAIPTDFNAETCNRWNKENFCNRSNHVPHRLWIRECLNCDHEDYAAVGPGEGNPWGDDS